MNNETELSNFKPESEHSFSPQQQMGILVRGLKKILPKISVKTVKIPRFQNVFLTVGFDGPPEVIIGFRKGFDNENQKSLFSSIEGLPVCLLNDVARLPNGEVFVTGSINIEGDIFTEFEEPIAEFARLILSVSPSSIPLRRPWHESEDILQSSDWDFPPEFREALRDANIQIVPRTRRPDAETQDWFWSGSALILPHPNRDVKVPPAQLLLAKEGLSEGVRERFRAAFMTHKRWYLLVDYALSEKDQVSPYLMVGYGYSAEDKATVATFTQSVHAHLPQYFGDGPARDVQVNDLAPTHDAPSHNPKLGFPEIAKELCSTIESVRRDALKKGVDANITIGLFGPWGSGKSTLMGALEKALLSVESDKACYVIIPVNAWKWDGSKSLHAHMLDTLRNVMGKELEEAARRKKQGFDRLYWGTMAFIKNVVLPLVPLVLISGSLLYVLIASGAWAWFHGFVSRSTETVDITAPGFSAQIGAGVTLFVGAITSVFRDSLRSWINGLFQSRVVKVSDQQRLAQTYADISEIGKQTGHTLAFFIDDLDRCTPDRVAEFVESIHNLTTAGCVTVVACDEEFVSAALNAKYERIVAHHPDGIGFGRSFLEKIVQVGFRMPALTEKGVQEAGLIRGDIDDPVLDAQLDENGILLQSGSLGSMGNNGDKPDEMVLRKSGVEENIAEPAEEDVGVELRPQINERLASETLDIMIRDFVQPMGMNMRRIKSLRNTVGLYLRIAAARGDIPTEDPAKATRLAAYLVADLVDRVWLDAYRLEQLESYRARPGLGDLSGRQSLQDKLASALGSPDALDDLYRLLGRQPRGLPTSSDHQSKP